MQSRLEVPAHRVDTDATLGVEQIVAVGDREAADVGGPTVVVPQQQEPVRRRQSSKETFVGHDVTPSHGLYGWRRFKALEERVHGESSGVLVSELPELLGDLAEGGHAVVVRVLVEQDSP